MCAACCFPQYQTTTGLSTHLHTSNQQYIDRICTQRISWYQKDIQKLLSYLFWGNNNKFCGGGVSNSLMHGWSHALSPLKMFSPRQKPSSSSFPKTQFPLNNQSQFCDVTCWTVDCIIICQFCNSVLAGRIIGRYMSVCACVFRCVFARALSPLW